MSERKQRLFFYDIHKCKIELFSILQSLPTDCQLPHNSVHSTLTFLGGSTTGEEDNNRERKKSSKIKSM